ncbi:MAG: hypothetical protein AAB320_07300 [Elusimicrobiota bacterium]
MRTPLALLLLACVSAAPARAYDTIRFLEPVKADEMAKPVAAAASGQRLYVVDEKKSVLLIYEASGRLLKVVGHPGSDRGGLRAPQGVTVGPQGRVFIADSGNSRIQILDADGEFLWSFGTKGSERGELSDPQAVAVGADGRVYVADTGNDRVQVFTAEGILLYGFGGKTTVARESDRFSNPSKIAVDPSDNVYVLDSGNERIAKFDSSAKFVKEFRVLGNDFVVDPYGFIYVLDPGNGKVAEQGPDGIMLGKFGSVGSGPGQFRKPGGLALSPEGSIYVLDTGNNRIQRIEIVNKLKTTLLPANLDTKLSVTGPSRSWPLAASMLAPLGLDALYAYLPKEGQFISLDEAGKETARFGAKQGKTPGVTHGTEGFAVSRKLGLYVSDTPANRLQRFGLDGVWKANLAETTGFMASNKKEGRLKDPRGVAINDEGTIYVADTGNRRIDAFSPEGVYLFGFGPTVGAFELKEPMAVAWDKAGFIYFVDKGLKRVFKCEPSGGFIASWGGEGEAPGLFQSPVSLAFDGNNYLYVLDDALRRVSVYTKDGRWMTDLFAGGQQERELNEPSALAVQGARLIIADKSQKTPRIVSFDLHPFLAAPSLVTAASKDGIVTLSWPAIADPWTAGYRVYRSTQEGGPFKELGFTKFPKYQDESVVSYERYYYRLATEAKTKDLGRVGQPVEVYVAGAFNKPPIEISTITLGSIFSANYKWYLKNSVGTAILTNNVNVAFQNVKLTFRLKDFMDFGYDTEIKKLEPQQTVEVPLIATLNNKILEVTEDTPIQAEFTLTYFESGKSQVVSLTKPTRVYSRNAITWEDPRRIANFVTPKDPPILEFMRETLRQAPKNPLAEGLNHNLVTALHLWDSLSETGVKFFSNPNSPYEEVSEDPNFPVDYTQFPRETLKRKTGQCDDLVTLLVAMFDGAKIRAAILDYPGHMALMFDTEAEAAEDIGLPAEDMILHEGTYWIPVEATLVGKPFNEAYRKALYAYKAEHEKGKVTILDVRKAWGTFEPATMPASDWTAEVPPPAARGRRFNEEVAVLASERYKSLKKRLEAKLKEDGKDVDARLQLGILEHQNGNQDAAVEEFNKVLAVEPDNASALTNLGNLAFLAGDNAGAEAQFLKAAAADAEDADIWLNLVKTAVRLKNKDKAQEYAQKAVALDASLKPIVDILLK